MEGPNITVISDPSPEELDLSSSSSEDFKVDHNNTQYSLTAFSFTIPILTS